MSAPLVINLKDGSVWERRAVTAAGVALYALAGSCNCPEYLMASESELAAQGIAGTADVLPVPAGPVDTDRAKAPWGRGEDGLPLLPMGAHWTDVPELVDKTVAKIQVRVDGATSGHWYDASVTETWRAPGTVRTNVDGYQVGVGQFIARPGDMELVLHAHDDLSWLLEMVAKFRARVAELEAERHSTNKSLDDAVQELRRRDDGVYPQGTAQRVQERRAAETHAHRNGACENCGAAPETWCPDCAACEQGCFGGFDGNECSHSKAKWGGR